MAYYLRNLFGGVASALLICPAPAERKSLPSAPAMSKGNRLESYWKSVGGYMGRTLTIESEKVAAIGKQEEAS